MSQGSGIQLENRSWTAEPSKSTNRRVIVAFLAISLMVLTGIFVSMLWRNSAGRTFVVSLAVTDYDERVAKPMFGVWDLQGFEAIAKENGLKPWTVVPSTAYQDLQNSPNLEAALTELPTQLQGLGLNSQDTLIVQLRCHAVVALDSDGEWNCGLFVGETTDSKNASDDTVYPIYKLLKRLKKVSAKNIVLMADICDLKSVPHRGWFVNPVTSYLVKACEKLSKDSNPPGNQLWIVCAATDAQSTHYSSKRKRTLFQAACEDSLQRTTKQNYLSLADYFEMTVRYCSAASEGKQSPRLIYANKAEVCSPDTAKSWQMAKQVLLSENKGSVKTKTQPNNTGKEPNGDNKATNKSVGIDRKTHLVSMHSISQDPNPSGLPSKDTPPTLDPDPSLRFWQLRDRILQANSDGQKKWRWTPAEFAPFLWRKLQMDASHDAAKSQSYERELKVFYGLQESGTPASEGSGQLAQAWNDFLTTNRNQKLWKDETILNDVEQEPWRRIRNEYRSYIDCLSELVFWRDLALEFPNELQTDYDRLFDVLEQARRSLPENDSEFALRKSSELRISDLAGKLKRSLSTSLARIIASVRRPGKLTWIDERTSQVLLASPLLRYEQRKELTELLAKKEITDTVPKNDEDLRKLLKVNDLDDGASAMSEWYCKSLRRSTSFFSDSPLAVPVSDKKTLLAWGQLYVQEIRRLGESLANRRTVHEWHYLSLIDFGFSSSMELTKSHSGIVVSPTKSRAIRLSVRPNFERLDFPRESEESQLAIDIKYGDETDVASCGLEWSIESSKSNTLPGMQLWIGGRPLKRDSRELIQPNAKGLFFNCKLSSDQIVPNQCAIKLIAFDPDGIASNPLLIPIFRNAARVHFIVTHANRGVQKQLPVHSCDIASLETFEQFDFESPAVFGATSRYSFSLANKQLMERKVKLSIYAFPRNEVSVLLREKKLPEQALLASSGPIILPAYSQNSQDVPTPLRTAKNASKSKPAMNIEANNDLLIFQIDEFENKGDVEIARGNPERWVGRFKPTNPVSSELVLVEPSRVESDQRLKMKLEGPLEFWQQLDLKELPIEVHSEWTDLKSKNQQTYPLQSSSIKLSKESPIETFIGEPMDPNKSFRFDLEVGRYPRAITYLAKPNSSRLEQVFPARIEIVEIEPLSKQFPKTVELKKSGQRWVFPNKIEGEAIVYDGIQVQAKADFALNQSASLIFSKEEGVNSNLIDRQEVESDRSVSVELGTNDDDAMLTVAYIPSELKIRQTKGIDKRLNGVYSIQLMSGNLVAKTELIFDRDPPLISRIQCDGKAELRPGGRLEILIEPDDGTSGSGVETVEFAISKDRDLANTEYNPNRIFAPLANPSWDGDGKRSRVFLDSKLLVGTPSGRVIIVANTVDLAGNRQPKNIPLSVYWDDSRAAVPSPK